MSHQKSDGMNYAPVGKPAPVVRPGEFIFAAAALDHGHIYGQSQGLTEAAASADTSSTPIQQKWRSSAKNIHKRSPSAPWMNCSRNPTSNSSPLPPSPMNVARSAAGSWKPAKDYFTDKTPFTTHEQLSHARSVAQRTGRKYMVYYSERLHVEASVRAGQLIEQGTIGRVVQVIGMGPHRSNPSTRPAWFWSREECGGILIDIGSHQFEQFLTYTGAKSAKIQHAAGRQLPSQGLS
jgi:hypothetical protein